MDYSSSGEGDPYEHSSGELSYEAPTPNWNKEEVGYGKSWGGDTYSSSEFDEEPEGEELDPEPPDRPQAHQGYPNPWIKLQEQFYRHGSKLPLTPVMSFSGKEDYLQWEEEMEGYFLDYNIHDEEKVSHAIDTIVGEAYQWWLHEEKCRRYHKEPPPDWEKLKRYMYDQFVTKKPIPRTCPKKAPTPVVKSQPTTPLLPKPQSANRGKLFVPFKIVELTFSGSSKEPEDYLRWETNMKRWLRSHNIPKEEKLSYALDALSGEAYEWWLREDAETYYTRPILDWGDLKARMYREFVKNLRNRNNTSPRPTYQAKPRTRSTSALLFREVKTELKKSSRTIQIVTEQSRATSSPATKNDKGHSRAITQIPTPSLAPVRQAPIQVKRVSPIAISTSLSELQCNPERGKPFTTLQVNEPTCYNCNMRGHFAVKCPNKQGVNSTTPELKPTSPKMNASLTKPDLSFDSSIIHLSLPKEVDVGLKEPADGIRGLTTELANQNKRPTLTPKRKRTPNIELIKDNMLEQADLENCVVTKTLSPDPAQTRPDYVSDITIYSAKILSHNLCGNQVSVNYEFIRYWDNFIFTRNFKYSVLNVDISSIIYLVLSLSVEKSSGTRRKHKNQEEGGNKKSIIAEQNRTEPVRFQHATQDDVLSSYVLLSYKPTTREERSTNGTVQIKEEPPDTKPLDQARGKLLSPRVIQATNLTYLCADQSVLRTKLLEGGGYDAVIKPAAKPEHIKTELRTRSPDLLATETSRTDLIANKVSKTELFATEIPKAELLAEKVSNTDLSAEKVSNTELLVLKVSKTELLAQKVDQKIIATREQEDDLKIASRQETICQADLNDPCYENTWRCQAYLWRPDKDDVKEETTADEKARGTETTLETDCTVRTAGLDPDPIGDSGTELTESTSVIYSERISDEGVIQIAGRTHRQALRHMRPQRYSRPHRQPLRHRRLQKHSRSRSRSRKRSRPDSRPLQRLYPSCHDDLNARSMNLDIPRHHLFAPKLSRLKRSRLALFGPIYCIFSNGYFFNLV